MQEAEKEGITRYRGVHVFSRIFPGIFPAVPEGTTTFCPVRQTRKKQHKSVLSENTELRKTKGREGEKKGRGEGRAIKCTPRCNNQFRISYIYIYMYIKYIYPIRTIYPHMGLGPGQALGPGPLQGTRAGSAARRQGPTRPGPM